MDCRERTIVERLYSDTGRAAILKTARMVGRLAVAEEIVQGAFLKLWQAQLAFPDARSAYAWIYRACHNAAIDHLRLHATRFEAAEPTEDDVALAVGDQRLNFVAERQWLAAQLSRLSGREAQILAYRVIDGMTQAEIAEVMGLSRKTVVRACSELEQKFKLAIVAEEAPA